MVAAQRHAGLVVDERPGALRAGLHVAAVAAEDGRCGPAPVDDEDRPVALARVQGRDERRQPNGEQPAIASRELRPEVDQLHGRCDARRALGQRAAAVHAGARQPVGLDGRGGAPQDHGGARQPTQRHGQVAGLDPRRPVALEGSVVLLVDDHQPHVRERCQDREASPDHHLDRARPDPPPCVRALALAEARMEDRHLDPQLRAQPVDERERERDLGHEDQGRAARLEHGRDRLRVDGGLARARRPVQEERRRVARGDGGDDDAQRVRLGRRQVGSRRAGAAAARSSSRGERVPGHLAGGERHQAAPRERRRRPLAVALREPGRRDAGIVGRQPGKLEEERPLPRPDRAAVGSAGPAGHLPSGIGQAGDALVARPRAGRGERPFEVDPAVALQRPQPPKEGCPAVWRGQVPDGPGTSGDREEQVGRRGITAGLRGFEPGCGRRRGRIERRGHQLELLEEPGREHRPDGERRRGQVVRRDLAGERQRERRQERPVGAHPRPQRPGRDAIGRRGVAQDDPHGPPAAPFHEDRFAGGHVGERIRDEVGPRSAPRNAGRVYRHLHVACGWRRLDPDEAIAADRRGRRPALRHRPRRRPGGRDASPVRRG